VGIEDNVDVSAMVESKCTGTKLKKAASVVSIRFHFHCPAKATERYSLSRVDYLSQSLFPKQVC